MSYQEMKEYLAQNQHTWLVTGVAGFIGSNIAETLLSLNQRVIGLDNFSTGKRENLAEIKRNNFFFIDGDVRHSSTCKEAMNGVDFVLHQAAIGSVPRSIKEPFFTHDNNVNGHLNILIAAKDAKIKRVVYASSSSVYGDHPGLPKVEESVGNCLSPYAVSKRVNELYSDVFYKNFGLESIGIRYFNVFGKRQDPDSTYAAVIPKWVKAMIRGEEVLIYGDGKTSRDFCYVENVVQMNILAALTNNEKAVNQVYNCACAEQTDLNTLFEMLKNGLGVNISPRYENFREGDIRHSLADISKAKNLLGYEPVFTIAEGLKNSLEWYRSHL